MIVVDASVAVLGLLVDGGARRLLADEQLVAPHLIDVEVLHVLRRQVRRGRLEAGAGRDAVRAWSRLGVERVAIVGLLDRMWALRDNVTAYDASYVALAEALDCTLVTADARLGGAPGPTCAVTVVRS